MSEPAPNPPSTCTPAESAQRAQVGSRAAGTAGDRGRLAAAEAARVLFARTEDAPAEVLPVRPATAVTLSELRHRAVTQSRLLERAADEIDALQARLDAARRRAGAAESALARERALRGRQNAEVAQRLAEQGREIEQLSREVRELRRSAGHEAGQRMQLERQLADRAALGERAGEMIATARHAVGEARALLGARTSRGERVEVALRSERAGRLAAERRLVAAETERRNQERTSERLRAECDELRAREGDPNGDTPPTGTLDVVAACRRLERELAAREALEMRAAQVIGRLGAHLTAAGEQATPSRGSAIISRGG